MSRTICITPSGRLILEASPETQPAVDGELAAKLDAAFERSSAEGLLLLVADALEAPLPSPLVFWRDFGRRFLHDVCQLGEEVERKWKQLPAPPEVELQSLVAAAPPMRGLEYLSPPLLARLWDELSEAAVERAKAHPDGAAGFLRSINPVWRLLGRVTLHLAENKRDPNRPFAFLATYTHRVSGARLQHLPLAGAVKEYAGAGNRDRLAALLAPVQQAAQRSQLIRELLDSKAIFQPQAWSIREAHRFLTETPLLEESGLVVRVPDWWNPRKPPRPQVQVRIGEKPAGGLGLDGLLDFSATLALDGEPLTAAELRRLLDESEGLALLRGRWVEVDKRRLQEALDHWDQLQELHPDGISFVEGMRLLAGAELDGREVEEAETAQWSRVIAGDWLRDTLEKLRDPRGVKMPAPGAAELRATLRPYQTDGVRWLWFMHKLGLGACLADDMGLGKTIQVIALLLHLKKESGKPKAESGGLSPSLLVVPASLVGNWKQELERFAPSLKAFYAHRSECDAETLDRVAEDPQRELADYDVVVATYGLARRGEWLAKVPWRLVVLDEAQAIKNAGSAQTRSVKKLNAGGRIALTGTPVENHLGDLWSIFDFCCPGLLGSAAQFKQFVKRLNKQQDAAAFGPLRRLVQPYILRRLKTDPNIVPDLPDKTEMRVECGLSKKQAVLYQRAVDDLAARLEESEGIARRGLVLSTLMQLKQICNHPAQYLTGAAFDPRDSGKLQRLEQICEPILERQEKMLVFTQFQTLCDPLAGFLAEVFGRSGLVLHGKTPVRRRTALVREFQEDRGPPFLVVSVKAGGSGLNLTAASHVVHFDRWWNPAVENQATDRAFRIGQKRNVLVHKFVCRGTVEERIDQMIRDKQGLAEAILDQGAEARLTEMTDDELLRFVALDLTRAAEEN